MAVDTKLIALVQRLHERTMQGRIQWKRTAEEGVYLATFPEYAVTIAKEPPDEYQNPKYFIRIHDQDGNVVDEISEHRLVSAFELLDDTQFPGMDERGIYNLMVDSYDSARNQATGADEAIDNLLKALST